MTAAMGLYQRLGLPLPWHPATKPIPLVIYGAASAVGSYAIQLAQLSNIHPLICVAGRGIQHVESLIDKSKGDMILDYRSGDESIVQGLRDAAKQHGKLEYALDAVSENGSYVNICKVLDRQTGQLTLVLPAKDDSDIPSTITTSMTACGGVFESTDRTHGKREWEPKLATRSLVLSCSGSSEEDWPVDGSKGSLTRWCQAACMGLRVL